MDMLEIEPEALGSLAGGREQPVVLLLGQVDKTAVVAEIRVTQFRVRVEPERTRWTGGETARVTLRTGAGGAALPRA